MYATIRRGKIAAGATQEIAQRINRGLVAELSQMPGFDAYYVLDLGSDELATITLFETQDQVEAANGHALHWIRQNLNDLVPNPPTVIEGHTLIAKSL